MKYEIQENYTNMKMLQLKKTRVMGSDQSLETENLASKINLELLQCTSNGKLQDLINEELEKGLRRERQQSLSWLS